jgi:LAO/AO transport system kinase
VEELLDALDAHRSRGGVAERRLRARRLHALADFAEEHGSRGMRALGGRRAAERWLAQQDPALDVAALGRALAERAGEGS